MKTRFLLLILSLLWGLNVVFSQTILLPDARGEVKRKDLIHNSFDLKHSQKTIDITRGVLNKLTGIILEWDKLQPPIGFEAGFTTTEQVLHDAKYNNPNDDPNPYVAGVVEIQFTPYVEDKELGKFADYRFSSRLNIFINNFSDYLPGNPLCKYIYVKPRKINSFFGADVYQTSRDKITLIAKKGLEVFLPVSQEEYLLACIKEESEKETGNPVPGKAEYLKEIENAYRELLKVDKKEADNYRNTALKDAEEFYSTKNTSVSSGFKKELETMSLSERKRQAYYSTQAIEKYNKISGLCPLSSIEEGEALIKINPALKGFDSSGEIKMLVINWIGDSREDTYMKKLYENEDIWRKIMSLVSGH